MTAVVRLADPELVVSYHEFGDPAGQVVLALHGVPSSGLGFDWADTAARERGIRLIAPDRPGIGDTTALPIARRVADYPAVITGFADALGLERFGVWGYSGGGPYALACAAMIPERLTGVAVAAGMGEIGEWAEFADFPSDERLMRWSIKHPSWARAQLRLLNLLITRMPKLSERGVAGDFGPADQELLQHPDVARSVLAMVSDAMRNGPAGIVNDYATVSQHWGFDVRDIAIPVRVFHGDSDGVVPLAHARELEKRIAGATLTVWPGAGHLGAVTHVGEVLDAFA